MKKLLVAACILFSSVSAIANDNEDKTVVAKFKVTTNKIGKMANLTFIPTTSEKVTVKILDEKGNVIFQEQILNKEGFSRPYNLSQLEGTEYTIVVKEGKTTYEEKISIGTTELSTTSKNLVATASRIDENRVELKVLQNTVNPVFIIMRDSAGKIVYTSTVTDRVSFVQKFHVRQVSNELSFEVKAGDVVKTIEL
ncbi:FimB/Mfa2 family fimbrial subunit [Marivirga sp. S37H4]|uniref:FimB/Mfa2 family fimbrial subunit n=1 Tax=Marivirga aurantiaca TaxID=2802615 RepID=A0A934X0G3_9BACT|nr:FimB/Mfa2 family fimbrial subunit [Marivirga aurantiaca]MBK6266197.1 FimB/Mfa2 family fimbrial subunit [Marivirga aurantiaca]